MNTIKIDVGMTPNVQDYLKESLKDVAASNDALKIDNNKVQKTELSTRSDASATGSDSDANTQLRALLQVVKASGGDDPLHDRSIQDIKNQVNKDTFPVALDTLIENIYQELYHKAIYNES